MEPNRRVRERVDSWNTCLLLLAVFLCGTVAGIAFTLLVIYYAMSVV